MHSCNTRLTILSLLFFLVAGGLGCSGGSSDPDISVATAALYPGAAVALTDSEACIVTTTTVGAAFGGEPSSTYRWLTYVAEQRIVRDIAIDAEGTPFRLSSIANSSTYRRLD